MKAVILAGGLGTRLSEETHSRPKPMVEIGGQPILWHIMKIYASHGVKDFVICCGYKGTVIKQFFANYFLNVSDVTFDLIGNSIKVHHTRAESWKVTLVDTGDLTMTGGRLRRVREHLDDEESFCFTYGDGVSDVNVSETIKFHREHGKQATLMAAYPPARFGALEIHSGQVRNFKEKPRGDGGMVNGGFFVLNTSVIDLIEGDQTIWEQQPLATLAEQGELMAYEHPGFWQPMDTLSDKTRLEDLWSSGQAPWKTWDA